MDTNFDNSNYDNSNLNNVDYGNTNYGNYDYGNNNYYTPEQNASPFPENNSEQPMTVKSYLGYMVLFSIPLIGFIASIILSFNDESKHRRSFARGFTIYSIIVAIYFVILISFIILIFSPLYSLRNI